MTLPSTPSNPVRRGAALLIVLGMAMVITVIAMTALLTNRTLARTAQFQIDHAQAEHLAQTALEFAVHAIDNNQQWRNDLPHGAWFEDVALSTGTFSVFGRDPVDGSLSNNDLDAVKILGIGEAGRARCGMEAVLQPTTKAYDCLHSFLHAGTHLNCVSTDLKSGSPCTSNGAVDALGGSNIYAEVVAAGSVSGSTFHETSVGNHEPVSMPTPANVMESYEKIGTTINLLTATIPPVPAVVHNSDFVNGTDAWQPIGDAVISPITVGQSDTSSVKVSGRQAAADGIGQDVTGRITKNGRLTVGCWVTPNDPTDIGVFGGADLSGPATAGQSSELTETASPEQSGVGADYAIFLKMETAQGTTSIQLTPYVRTAGPWVYVSATERIHWDGTLQRATIYIRSQARSQSFWVDDFTVVDEHSEVLIHRMVFSPNHNPLGSITNPQGVYVIDCDGATVALDRIKVQGTLVLKDVGAGSLVRGSACRFEPVNPGWPCLIVDGDMSLQCTDDALTESVNAANFNPPDAADFELGSDLDQNDSFPAGFFGLVYVVGDLSIKNETVLSGPVIAEKGIILDNIHLFPNRQTVYREVNPPPGFGTTHIMMSRQSIATAAAIRPATTAVPSVPVTPEGTVPSDAGSEFEMETAVDIKF